MSEHSNALKMYSNTIMDFSKQKSNIMQMTFCLFLFFVTLLLVYKINATQGDHTRRSHN